MNRKGGPIRVLHVVGGMNRGGVETWLMHVLRKIDRQQFQMDFLVHTREPCAYDDEIRALGSKIIPCLSPKKPWFYALNIRRILKEQGPFDVVHSHVHHFSGFVLWLASLSKVPIRIAHSHNDTRRMDHGETALRKGYLLLTKRLIKKYATIGLACSREAAVALYGVDWENDPRLRVLYYGIDLEPFRQPVDRVKVRRELNIPFDALVIGHVGRFNEQKNHNFLIEITAEIAKIEPNVRLLLIGDGPLRTFIENKVKALGLIDNVIFAGIRSDIPRLMKGAMDVFLLPSLFEGLPIVGIEAQASGLPLVISDSITKETGIIRELIVWKSLSTSAADWADIICQVKENQRDSKTALVSLDNTLFNIEQSMRRLEELYHAT
jgi:glycosyltransferase involved in cell wall biosynthesis